MHLLLSILNSTLFNATINKACLGRSRGLNSQLGNPRALCKRALESTSPDVIRLNLLMLIAPPLHRNCGKLLNGEIFVAQVYFVMFNARRAAVAEYTLHFLPGPLRGAIPRYARSSRARSPIAVTGSLPNIISLRRIRNNCCRIPYRDEWRIDFALYAHSRAPLNLFARALTYL